MTVSLRDTRSEELYARALQYLPGGVNSPVRAMRAIGRDPLFIERGAGAELTDVDGNTYVDYVCSWGPLILGHAQPAVVAAIEDGAPRRDDVRRTDRGRGRARRGGHRRVPGIEMLRMTSSGTEAAMSAIRLARAATGREKLLKFAGAYHGHVDGLLAAGRQRPGDPGDPVEPRCSRGAPRRTP